MAWPEFLGLVRDGGFIGSLMGDSACHLLGRVALVIVLFIGFRDGLAKRAGPRARR